eukprot:365268-Chlamydomonas_euryale.AAC.9
MCPGATHSCAPAPHTHVPRRHTLMCRAATHWVRCRPDRRDGRAADVGRLGHGGEGAVGHQHAHGPRPLDAATERGAAAERGRVGQPGCARRGGRGAAAAAAERRRGAGRVPGIPRDRGRRGARGAAGSAGDGGGRWCGWCKRGEQRACGAVAAAGTARTGGRQQEQDVHGCARHWPTPEIQTAASMPGIHRTGPYLVCARFAVPMCCSDLTSFSDACCPLSAQPCGAIGCCIATGHRRVDLYRKGFGRRTGTCAEAQLSVGPMLSESLWLF